MKQIMNRYESTVHNCAKNEVKLRELTMGIIIIISSSMNMSVRNLI